MASFRVSGDLRVAFVIEVEADSQEKAEAYVSGLSAKQVENEGSLEGMDTAAVEIDGCEKL